MRHIPATIFLLAAGSLAAQPPPEFWRDVAPVLESRCAGCHQRGGIAPMPLETYRDARPWARAIREAVLTRRMPPWPADARFGRFSNDRSLSENEIRALAGWAASGAREGNGGAGLIRPRDPTPHPAAGLALAMPEPFRVPAGAVIEYQYVVLPTGLATDRWVRDARVIPGTPAVVHHAVLYVREPGSAWLREARPGVPFSFPRARDPRSLTTSDILHVYTPGNPESSWPAGYAKKIPAGSDLILQVHYTSVKHDAADRTRIEISFADSPPVKRVLTLQIGNHRFAIPPGEPDYRVQASGTLPDAAELLSLFPHMHLRGKAFEYLLEAPGSPPEVALRIPKYDFYWQLQYVLAEPRRLPAGTRITCTAWFDNSANNPRNPDPSAEVSYGEQSFEEMMIGFFDVAVDAALDKDAYFGRRAKARE